VIYNGVATKLNSTAFMLYLASDEMVANHIPSLSSDLSIRRKARLSDSSFCAGTSPFPNSQLILAGSGEENYATTCRTLAKELGIENQVLFVDMSMTLAKSTRVRMPF